MASEEKERLREQRAAERESIAVIRDACALNLGSNPDRFYEIIQGTYKPPVLDGDKPSITASVNTDAFREQARKLKGEKSVSSIEEETEDDEVEMIEPIRRSGKSQTRSLPKYAQVVERLNRFPFSDKPEEFNKQMAIVDEAIRAGMNKLILQEVAKNTRKAFGKYVKACQVAPGGIKVSYNFGSDDIVVWAKGNFYGDETVCVHSKAGELEALVLKIDGEHHTNLSSHFEINMG